MRLRDLSGVLGALLLGSTMFLGTCRTVLNRENDGLQPVQSTTATILGYSRDVVCQEIPGDDYDHWSWDCGMDKPILLEPYRTWLISDRLKPIAWYGSIKLELLLAVILLVIGLSQKDPNDGYYR